MYAFLIEWNPVIEKLLIKAAIIAGSVAVALLVIMLVKNAPKRFWQKSALAILAFVIAFAATWMLSNREEPLLTEEEAAAKLDEALATLTGDDEDYGELFGATPVRTQLGEVTPGNPLITRVFLRRVPMPAPGGGEAGQFVQIGRVTVNRKTGAVTSGISEFPQFPSCKKITALAGANSDADGQVIGAPMRFVPDTNPPLPFAPPAVEPGTALVVTNYKALKINHPGEFSQLKSYLEGLGTVLDTSEQGQDEAAIQKRIREIVKRDDKTAVFIFGNADVVPFKKRVNPLYHPDDDPDIIFGDDYYADLDDDPLLLPDIDVGRVPDDPAIVRNPNSILYKAGLSAEPLQRMELCSLSNFHRDSSALLVAEINPAVEGGNLIKSLPHNSKSMPTEFYAGRSLFICLHGTLCEVEGHLYWGQQYDKEDNNWPVGFEAGMAQPAELVWSAACYGGHIVNKSAENSIALDFMAKGCRTFVGFSGSHWSATKSLRANGQLFAKMFFDDIKRGYPPSTAFRLAKNRFGGQLSSDREKKVLFEAIYYGIPALQPVESKELDPPEEPATPVSIATAVGVPPSEPPLLTTNFGSSSLEPTQWVTPSNGEQHGSWKIGNGTMQVSGYGPPPPQPVPILSTAPTHTVTGDWTVAVRVPRFKFQGGGGRYGLNFTIGTKNNPQGFQQGLLFDSNWGDGLWRTLHGPGGQPKQQQLDEITRAVTMVMKKVGNLVTFFINQREIHSVQLTTAPAEPFQLAVTHSWGEGAKAEVDIDYIYLFGERGEPVDEPEPEPPASQGTPRGVVESYFAAYRNEDAEGVIALFEPDSDFRKNTDVTALEAIFARLDFDRKIDQIAHESTEGEDAEVSVYAVSTTSSGKRELAAFDFYLKKADAGWLIDYIETRVIKVPGSSDDPDSEEAEPELAAAENTPRGGVTRFFELFHEERAKEMIALLHPDSRLREAMTPEVMAADFAEHDYHHEVLDTVLKSSDDEEAVVHATVRSTQTRRGEEPKAAKPTVFAATVKKVGDRWLIDSLDEADGGMMEPAPSAGSGGADRDALEAFVEELFEVLQSEDIDALTALYDPESWNRDNQLKLARSDFDKFDRQFDIGRIKINDPSDGSADIRVYLTRRQRSPSSEDWASVRHEMGLTMREVDGKWRLITFGVRGFWSP